MNGEIISICGKQNFPAAEDKFGILGNRNILFTKRLIRKLQKEELLAVLVKGLTEAENQCPYIREIEINGREIWLKDNGEDLKFLLPEDSHLVSDDY